MTSDETVEVLKERIEYLRNEAERIAQHSADSEERNKDKIKELVDAANRNQQRLDEIAQEVQRHGRIIDTVRGVLYVLASGLTILMGFNSDFIQNLVTQ